jgi:hypothetical protein
MSYNLPLKGQVQTLVEQFQSFVVSSPTVSDEDKYQLVSLLQHTCILVGDINQHLQDHSALLACVSWYYHKYNNLLISKENELNGSYGKIYSRYRERGYDEWTAKRMTDSSEEILELVSVKDRDKNLVGILSSLVDVVKQRFTALQQLSNNYRAELKDDKANLT